MESLNPNMNHELDGDGKMIHYEYIHELIIASSSFSSRCVLEKGENWLVLSGSSSSCHEEKKGTVGNEKEEDQHTHEHYDITNDKKRIILLDEFLSYSSNRQHTTGGSSDHISESMNFDSDGKSNKDHSKNNCTASNGATISQPSNDGKLIGPRRFSTSRVKNQLLCIDVDGPYVAIKDLRQPQNDQQSTSFPVQQNQLNEGSFYLSRQKKTVSSQDLNHKIHDDIHRSHENNKNDMELLLTYFLNTNKIMKQSETSHLEPLPPRQMRILHDQDELFFISYPQQSNQRINCMVENRELENDSFRIVKLLYQFKRQPISHRKDSNDRGFSEKGVLIQTSKTLEKNLTQLIQQNPRKQNLYTIEEEENKNSNEKLIQNDKIEEQQLPHNNDSTKHRNDKRNVETMIMDDDTSFFTDYTSAAAIASQGVSISLNLHSSNNISNNGNCEKDLSEDKQNLKHREKIISSKNSNIDNIYNKDDTDENSYDNAHEINDKNNDKGNHEKKSEEGHPLYPAVCISGKVELNDQGDVSATIGGNDDSDKTASNNKSKSNSSVTSQPKFDKNSPGVEESEMHVNSNENKMFLTQPEEEDSTEYNNTNNDENSFERLVDPDETQRYDIILPSQAHAVGRNMKNGNEKDDESCSLIPSSESSTTTMDHVVDENDDKPLKNIRTDDSAVSKSNDISSPSPVNDSNSICDSYDAPTQVYNGTSPLSSRSNDNSNQVSPINNNDDINDKSLTTDDRKESIKSLNEEIRKNESLEGDDEQFQEEIEQPMLPSPLAEVNDNTAIKIKKNENIAHQIKYSDERKNEKLSNTSVINTPPIKLDQTDLHQRLMRSKERRTDEIEESESSSPMENSRKLKKYESSSKKYPSISENNNFHNDDNTQSQNTKKKLIEESNEKVGSSKHSKIPETAKQLSDTQITPSFEECKLKQKSVGKLNKFLLKQVTHEKENLLSDGGEQTVQLTKQSTKIEHKYEGDDLRTKNIPSSPKATEAKLLQTTPLKPSLSKVSNETEKEKLRNRNKESIQSKSILCSDKDIPPKYDHSHLHQLSQETITTVNSIAKLDSSYHHQGSFEKKSGNEKKADSVSPRASLKTNLTKTSFEMMETKTPTIVTRKRRRGTNLQETTMSALTPRSKNRENESESVQIIFTGLEVTKKYRSMAKSIGAKIVEKIEDAKFATHVIAGDGDENLRRTPKLMICLCCTENILHLDWLIQSHKAKKALECFPFLLRDKSAESKYNFSMLETIKNGSMIRSQQGGGILDQYKIYFSKGVAGNKAPPSNELDLIIDAAGGTVLKSLTEKSVKDISPLDIIIVTSDPATPSQKKDKNVSKLTKLGAKIVTTSWLFDCFMHQRVCFSGDTRSNEENVNKNRKRERVKPSSISNKETVSPSRISTKRKRRKK